MNTIASTSAKNHYETLIDNLMVQEVAGHDPELYNLLLNTDPRKRRSGILSILDKGRNMFMSIKNVIKSNTLNKTEHIKDVVRMLRDYVKVGEVEKKKFGEVMTPISLVNEMLDTLPSEVWSNPDLKWLDPANGCGVFPSVVVERLMVGLSTWQPDEDLRYKHIMENMIYVCEIQPKNMFLYLCAFDPNDEYELNVYTGSFLDQGFDDHMKNVWGVGKFDIVVGNVPYQESDGGGTGDSAKPLYNLFTEKSYNISDKIIFVIPSKWMLGGKGLDGFRDKMINSFQISKIFDVESSSGWFPGINLDGGACYFLSDKNYLDKLCDFTHLTKNGLIIKSHRELGFQNKIYRDIRYVELYKKIINAGKESFSLNISAQKPYGFRADIFNDPIKYSHLDMSTEKDSPDKVKIYGVKGIKGGAKRTEGYILPNDDLKNNPFYGKYNIFFSKAFDFKSTIPPKPVIGLPYEICSETFLNIGPFNNIDQTLSCISYMQTKFFRFLFKMNRSNMNISKKVFDLIPNVSFDRIWSDEDLYKEYCLSEKEISLIEDTVSPLNWEINL